CVRGSSYDYW
nr:immunoglobulin heavy chain junction region [Mus musculus]